MDAFVNAKNRVPQLQRTYQASHRPIYAATPRGRIYYNTYLALFATGILGTAYGISTVIRGKK